MSCFHPGTLLISLLCLVLFPAIHGARSYVGGLTYATAEVGDQVSFRDAGTVPVQPFGLGSVQDMALFAQVHSRPDRQQAEQC